MTRFRQWATFGHFNVTLLWAAGIGPKKRKPFYSATVASELYGRLVISQLLQSAALGFAEMTNNKGEERQQ